MRSESSSGGSSPSDLRKRLQHHPSPNEAARLANRVISISRRLSRKRDYYFHGTTNRIEENIEREEREERETVYSKRSYSDLKSKDARTRRRAKIRLENERNRAMVVSKPNEICPPDLKNDSNNGGQRSGRNSLLDNKMEGIKEENSEQQTSFGIDVLTSDPQRYSPLSSRLPSTSGLYRNQQDEGSNDSSRSRGSASFLHLYSSASCENSPKNRIELQPLSPISIKNSPQNKYRPCRGVILQNLSSGSEAESGFEVMSDRIGMKKKIDRLIPIAPQETEISLHLCGSPKIQNMNNSPLSVPLSSRKSSNYVLVKSSRNDYMENIVASPVSGMNYIENKFQQQSLNDPPTFALNMRKNLSRDRSFYRALDTSRSDCSQDMRNSGVGKSGVDEPLFFSAREETIRDYNRERFETKPLRETSFYPISPRVLPNPETSRNVMSYDHVINIEQNFAVDVNAKKNCDIVFGDQTEMSTSQYVDPTNSNPCVNQTFVLTPRTIRSPEIILKSPITYENPLDANKSEFYPTNITNTIALKEAISKRILNYESNNENKNSQLQNIILPPEFKICGSSEIQSRTSSFTEFFAGDSTKSRENIFSPEFSVRNNEETRILDEDKINSDQEFVNVPTLVLNSQEVSFSTSPASKICSERHLDTDTLIMALSNASLDQKATKDVSENTCSESCPDSKTISRPDSFDNLQMDTNVESRLKSDESHTKLITSRTSCRSSFLSIRSKIPVKIPTDRSRMSLTSKYSESEKRTFSQRTNLNDSSRQTFGSNTSSPEGYRYESERSNETCKSHESSPYAKSYEDIRNSGEVTYRRVNTTDTMEQEKYSDSNYEKSEREKERLGNVEKSTLTLEAVPSKTCLSLPCEPGKENKEGKEGDQNAFVKSSVNRNVTRGDGFRLTDSAENSRKSEKSVKSKCVGEISSNDDSDSSSSRDYSVQKSVKGIEVYDESCNFISSRIGPSDSSTSYRNKHVNVYEGEIFEKIVESRKPPNLFENQIGDGGHEILMEDPDKLKYESLNASPDDEEVIKTEMNIERENYKPQRFSLEKLAAEQFRRTMNSEQTKIIQSDTATFFPNDKFCEMPQFILSCSSSTPKLRHDKSKESPRFKKKSQDRFPFTISEKTSIASMKFKVPGRLGNLDEDAENKGYTLDMHPSITRLAGSGFEDSPTEIISYVAQTELENRYGKSSGMKGLVKKFSARWKKQKKCEEEEEADGKTTSIIYKNRDYREERESSVDSCSESSSLQEFKIYESLEEKLCKPEPNPDSPDEKSSVIRDDHPFMGECSKNVSTSTENPCRRYDRDDLWVQDLKDSNSSREEQKKNEETSRKMDGTKTKNPYSVFFVKSTQVTPQTSARPFVSESVKKKQHILTQKKSNRVKFHNSSLVIVPKRSNENVHEKSKNRNSERNKKKDMESGCFCLRFYRMIIPGSFGSISKYRSKTNDNSPSIKKRSPVSLQRKKG